MVYADHWDFITELDLKKERIYIKAKTIQTNKNLLVNKDKTENRTIKSEEIETEMEKRHQVRIKTLWSGRYKKEERFIKHCTIKQRTSMVNEMENKAKDKATSV